MDHSIPHGLAVAGGMDLMNFVSMKRGKLHATLYEEIHDSIHAMLPYQLSRTPSAAELIQASRRDKKAQDGDLNLIFLEQDGDWGKLCIRRTKLDADLESQIQEYLETD